jgi:hypothetical protein
MDMGDPATPTTGHKRSGSDGTAGRRKRARRDDEEVFQSEEGMFRVIVIRYNRLNKLKFCRGSARGR